MCCMCSHKGHYLFIYLFFCTKNIEGMQAVEENEIQHYLGSG